MPDHISADHISAGHISAGHISAEQFERLVDEALDSVPADLLDKVSNCAVLVEDDPPPDSPHLLGLYEGIPLTERGDFYAGMLPDRIRIFRRPLLAISATEDEVVAQVRVTVIHEIAHYFGIDDERLAELGWA